MNSPVRILQGGLVKVERDLLKDMERLAVGVNNVSASNSKIHKLSDKVIKQIRKVKL